MTEQTDHTDKPSGLRRLITILLLVAVLVCVAMELRGWQGYQQTLSGLEDAYDTARGSREADKQLTVAKAKKLGALWPSYATGDGDLGKEMKMSWFSPLSVLTGRDYSIYLVLSKEGDDARVMSLVTAGERAEVEKMRAKAKANGGAKVVNVGKPSEGEGRRASMAPLAQLAAAESIVAALDLSDDQKTELAELSKEVKQQSEEAKQVAANEQGASITDILRGMQVDWNAKLKNIVGDDAMKRLTQIELQKAGAKALTRPGIMNAMKLTTEQIQAGADDPSKILESLTDEQKKKWQEMIGEPFETP